MEFRNIAVIGAGAVGSLVGGRLTKAGHRVTMIDLWPAHVDYLKKSDLRVTTVESSSEVKVDIHHLHEAAGLHRTYDLIFSGVNGYDIEWAMTLMEPFLAKQGLVVPLHDGFVEERVARIVGRGRVMGVVIDRLGVNLSQPGNAVRYLPNHPNTFILGELGGGQSTRPKELAALLGNVAGTIATDDIQSFHWSKLPRDCTRSPITTLAGVAVNEAGADDIIRRASILVISEVVRVGLALGQTFRAATLMDIESDLWANVAKKDVFEEVERRFIAAAKLITIPRGMTSMGQHMIKRRRTEIDVLNGFVVEKGREAGLPTPLNAAVTSAIHAMERGELKPGIQNIENVLKAA